MGQNSIRVFHGALKMRMINPGYDENDSCRTPTEESVGLARRALR